MKFRGRTVIAFMVATMMCSVLVTLTLADKLIEKPLTIPASISAAAQVPKGDERSYSLTQDEISKLNAVFELVESKYISEVDRDDLIYGAISGVMGALNDPYSVFMEQNTASQFSQSIEGSFSGIGAEITTENGQIIVVSPIKGSPAERSGLLAKDIILSVNGESMNGLSLQDAVNKIRGEKGTKAKIEVQRVGVSEPISLVIIRDDIDIETVYSTLDKASGVGTITITQFSMNTAERFQEELLSLEEQGLKGLVIDVRNNPGGVLQGVVAIAQLMMDEGSVVVQVEDRTGKTEKTYAKGGKKKNYPISVLTNNGSASASEILAAALQEGANAKVIGEKSFGKGTVQVSYNQVLKDEGLIKLTVAKWLTPDGNWIHEKGVTPDINVEPPEIYRVARLNIVEEMKKDQYSEQIKSAQIMLEGLGYNPGRKDGYFNEDTEKAFEQFQSKMGITRTGKLDEATAAALEKAVISWLQEEKNDIQLQKAIEYVSRKQ